MIDKQIKAKIVFEKTDGEMIELSIEGAKELYGLLSDIFGRKYVPSVPLVFEKAVSLWPSPLYNTGRIQNEKP